MIQKIKKFIVMGIAGLTLLSPTIAVPVIGGIAAADNVSTNLCGGVDAATGAGNCSTQTTGGSAESGLKGLASTIVKYFSIIVGAASVIMIIYGGFRYITSGGDSGKVGNAKNTLIYALIGLIIVALAQLIVRVVISQANTSSSTFGSLL